MSFITAEDYANARVYTISVESKNYFWVTMFDVQKGLGLKSLCDLLRKELSRIYETKNITKEQKKRYIKTRKEINKSLENDFNDKCVRNGLIEKIIKNCRGVKKCNNDINKIEKKSKRENFRSLLGFKKNDIFQSKEYSIIEKIKTVFSSEKILLQHSVFTYKIYVYFPKHKLANEIDKQGHQNRNINYEIQRQKAIEKERGCEFIRKNPDKENFDIFV